MIAVDPSSAGGYLFPWGLILEQGLRQGDFAEIAFAPGPGGKQEKVVMAVYSGKYDAGTIREGTLSLLAIKLISNRSGCWPKRRIIPDGCMRSPRVGPRHTERLKQALLALDPQNPENKKILDAAGFIGVQEASEADFEPIRQKMAIIEKYRTPQKLSGPPRVGISGPGPIKMRA